MQIRLLTFGVWALVAASATFWGLRLSVQGAPWPAQTQLPQRSPVLGGDLQRLLGVTASDEEPEAPDDAAGRFQLLGVVAPRANEASPEGVALISVGGQAAKAWRTGAVVEGDTVLLAVTRRGAQLGPRGGPATIELTLPDPARSAAPALAAGVARGFGAPGGAGQVAGQVPGRIAPGMAAPGLRTAQPPATQEADEDDEE